MIVLRQKEYTRAEKEAMFQLMRLTKGFKSLPKSLNSVENAKRFKKFSNRLVKFANDPVEHKLSAEELKEMKSFLSDIGATKFADNFEPIVNKYYGLDNVEAWKRLKLKEDSLPVEALMNRYGKLEKRITNEQNIKNEVESYSKNRKFVKGKSNKEIFSSPEGKLVKNIVKGETGEVGQPGIYFNKVKDREKLSDILANKIVKEDNLTEDAGKELKKKARKQLRKYNNNSLYYVEDGNYGDVFLSTADPEALSHELGHAKSLANSIKADTIYTGKVLGTPIKEVPLIDSYPVMKRLDAMYNRLNHLSTVAEENMANAYGRDIIRKYGGKNVDKHLANYEKMVDNLNMKSYLSAARRNDVADNITAVIDIYGKKSR